MNLRDRTPVRGCPRPEPVIKLGCVASPSVGGFAGRGRSPATPGVRWTEWSDALRSCAMRRENVGYVKALRRKIGHDPVIMTCAGCAVFDRAGRLLLQQRGDDHGPWGLPGGDMERGETIEASAVRKTFEETGLRVRPDTLLGVYTGDVHTCSKPRWLSRPNRPQRWSGCCTRLAHGRDRDRSSGAAGGQRRASRPLVPGSIRLATDAGGDSCGPGAGRPGLA